MMIFGCGYSGTAIAKAFGDSGIRVTGTTRSEEKAEELRKIGIEAFIFNGGDLSDDLRAAMATVTHLVQSIAPRDADPLLALLGKDSTVLLPDLQWIGYLSTVGVYGDHKGSWVTEETPCIPVSGRSKERLDAEDAWLALGRSRETPAAILRLSGIYGPGRNAFVNLDRGTARRIIKKDQVFNRIRVEDIGASTRFLSEHDPARHLLVSAAFCALLAGLPVAIAGAFDLPTSRTDLSDADLKRVADITRPTSDFSKAEPYEAM